MKSKRPNILFICSDQHSKSVLGCYGNPHVLTPNIDKLAERGTRFTQACSSNPICVPARASLATGQYCFKLRTWDNASPYTGQARSYGHRLEENGIPVTTIGKLHYRNASDDTGFFDQRIPLHMRDGVGDLFGTLRVPDVTKTIMREEVKKARCGHSSYVDYDKKITEETLAYLDGKKDSDTPWTLYVGYTFPHLPFVCPEETWGLYNEDELPLPVQYKKGERPEHGSSKDMRRFFGLEEEFELSEIKKAVHAYYGMCSFLDMQVGIVLKRLEELGLDENTYVIYSTDHGEMLGNHGLWFKNCMFEESVGIPMIIAGPGIPGNKVTETKASLVDIYPTMLDLMKIEPADEEKELPGMSLYRIAQSEQEIERTIFSEFHASGSNTGGFMVRNGDYKYIYYVGYPPQLFNLKSDPHELCDLAGEERYSSVLEKMDKILRGICDPEKVNAQVKEEQEEKLNLYGGREKIIESFVPIIFSPPPKV